MFNTRLHHAERSAGRAWFLANPVLLQLEITNRCNLRCPICARPYYDESQNPPGEMPLELLEILDPFIWSAREVLLGGYGEPLCGGSFWPILERCLAGGARVSVITNGTLVDDEVARCWVSRGLHRLIVSLDGVADETLLRLRGVRPESVLRGIAAVNQAKARSGAHLPELQINFTVNRHNLGELSALVQLAAEQAVRQINVTHQKLFSSEQEEWSLLGAPGAACAHFSAAEREARARGVVLKLPSLFSTSSICHQPFEMLFIRWDGEVMGCCSAIFRGHPYRFSLGMLTQDNLRALWNGAPMMAYRQAVLTGETAFPAPCQHCAFREASLKSHCRFLDGQKAGNRT